VLIVLLPRNPHLMEGPQTSQYAASNPACKPPLHRHPTRLNPGSQTGKHNLQLVIQTVREAMNEAATTHDNDVGEEERPDVDVHG